MSQEKTVPRRSRSGKGSSCAPLAMVGVILLGCVLGFCVLAWWGIPAQAAAIYGEPAEWITGSDLVLYSTQIILNQDSLIQPVDTDAEKRTFLIAEGDSVNTIVNHLESAGLVKSAAALRSYLIYKGLDVRLQAGEYSLSPAMTGVEIANRLQDATPEDVIFIILPGWRAEEIAAALPTSGLDISPDEFLEIVYHPSAADMPLDLELPSLEGYLMPGEYKVPRATKAVGLVKLFVSRFESFITPELRQKYNNHGLKLSQAVILASIVQREAVVTSEQGLIASVFYNRINAGMKLESDPTVQYALGNQDSSNGFWKSPLSLNDLAVDSAYNTYQISGLPPAPICSPGLSALRAVAEPETSDYFFFQARCDGSGLHSFAVTFDEHLQNSCQ